MTKKELLKVIEETARSKQTKLFLVRRGIIELPEEIGQLTNLESLYLSERGSEPRASGLKRLPTYTGDYLWLCEAYFEQMQPKIPDKID